MKKLLIATLVLSLTACATPPRFLAAYGNSQDKCQSYGKGANYQQPDWCYKGNSTTVVVDRRAPGTYSVYTTR